MFSVRMLFGDREILLSVFEEYFCLPLKSTVCHKKRIMCSKNFIMIGKVWTAERCVQSVY